MLGMTSPGGPTLRVSLKGTAIRPALIVELSLEGARLTAEQIQRFFDGEWPEHPAGPAGALMLAGAARIARLHGGRTDVRSAEPGGCVVTFVIPKPL
jgi:hypothetical protein